MDPKAFQSTLKYPSVKPHLGPFSCVSSLPHHLDLAGNPYFRVFRWGTYQNWHAGWFSVLLPPHQKWTQPWHKRGEVDGRERQHLCCVAPPRCRGRNTTYGSTCAALASAVQNNSLQNIHIGKLCVNWMCVSQHSDLHLLQFCGVSKHCECICLSCQGIRYSEVNKSWVKSMAYATRRKPKSQ